MMKSTSVIILLLHTTTLVSRGEITLSSITPSHYDYLEPPVENAQPVNVTIDLIILSIRSVDENDLSFSVTIEVWQHWKDWRLMYPNETKERFTILDSKWKDKIWNPSLYFVNAVDGKLDDIIIPSSFFWLDVRHNIHYCCKLSLKLTCEMDFRYFPHDKQFCSIQMASAKYASDKVIFNWRMNERKSMKKNFTGLPQYNLASLKKLRCFIPMGRTSNCTCLEAEMGLVRRTGYYIINVYIPTVLIVLMSMMTFWIPPDAIPARITLGVTSLLTIITKQYDTSLPNVSYIVALNVWLSCCIGFVFLSLVEYAALIAISAKEKNPDQERSEELILPLIQLRINGTWGVKKAWRAKPKKRFEPKRLDFISRVAFPLFFGVFCLIYWLTYDK